MHSLRNIAASATLAARQTTVGLLHDAQLVGCAEHSATPLADRLQGRFASVGALGWRSLCGGPLRAESRNGLGTICRPFSAHWYLSFQGELSQTTLAFWEALRRDEDDVAPSRQELQPESRIDQGTVDLIRPVPVKVSHGFEALEF